MMPRCMVHVDNGHAAIENHGKTIHVVATRSPVLDILEEGAMCDTRMSATRGKTDKAGSQRGEREW